MKKLFSNKYLPGQTTESCQVTVEKVNVNGASHQSIKTFQRHLRSPYLKVLPLKIPKLQKGNSVYSAEVKTKGTLVSGKNNINAVETGGLSESSNGVSISERIANAQSAESCKLQ